MYFVMVPFQIYLSKMAKLFPVVVSLVVFHMALTCSATMYMVGDTSGWEISTDFDTWTKGKKFAVGDTLVFQYPSSENVCEVSKESYNKCNTTNPIRTYSNGNTTVSLTKPGDQYFISGNRLYCLGGMKLHVTVEGDQAPAPAPLSEQGAPGALHGASSKSNDPSNVIPASAAPNYGIMDMMTIGVLGFMATLLCIKCG